LYGNGEINFCQIIFAKFWPDRMALVQKLCGKEYNYICSCAHFIFLGRTVLSPTKKNLEGGRRDTRQILHRMSG
jgi:hypothetical protein